MAGKKRAASKKSRKSPRVGAGESSGDYVKCGMQIAILDRGFVYVGDVQTNSEWCVISNARNVRQWGTKEGLGELAIKGPLPNTILDETGTVRAPLKSLIALIACNPSSWKS
jgi:hypothetical protein